MGATSWTESVYASIPGRDVCLPAGHQLQNEHEISYVMTNTDPKYVGFVLDTGHITMADMDPRALARKLGNMTANDIRNTMKIAL